MKTALKILSNEHKNILMVIDALSKECDYLQSESKINIDFFKKAIDFVRGYADKFHHAKEEDILFVELCKGDVQMPCNPTQQMIYEHELGRDFISELERGIEKNDKDKIIENAKGYAQLLQDHIFKEENILYPMAEKALDKSIRDEMLVKFAQIEQSFIKDNEKYLLFLKELKKKK